MLQRSKPVRKSRRGAAVVETAVILSMLLLVILGVLEYGRLVMLRQALNSAAREGARLAVVGAGTLTTAAATKAIEDQVRSVMSGQVLANLKVSVYLADEKTGGNIGSWDTAAYGTALAVRVEGDYASVLPTTLGILPDPFHLTATSMMRSEAN